MTTVFRVRWLSEHHLAAFSLPRKVRLSHFSTSLKTGQQHSFSQRDSAIKVLFEHHHRVISLSQDALRD
jgi:hypothetical protein